MRIKRFLTAVTAAALAAALAMPLPAAAAGSSYSDISDPATAVNADILRLMGVAAGSGNNQFNPNGGLTRAEFCTMVVKFMQRGDEVPIYATRTIFSDVTASHWGLGYVNLAASINVGTAEAPAALIAGVGDGRFEPDSPITQAQAVTILIRVLKYSGEQTGAVWPQSYMNLAGSIGLTEGLPADYNRPLTRAQAAQLFVNALSCKTGEGTVYYKSLGQTTDGVIVLAVNVETDDGSANGAIRTSANKESEAYLPASGQANPTALQGKRGALVLNDKNEIITFVPDDSSATTITLSGDAQPSYVKGSNGSQYTMSGDTILYTAAASEGKPYVQGYTDLKSGTQITMYSERGKIVAVYAGGAASASADAVVVMGSPSTAMFHQLTGGVTNFTIQKNRQSIRMSDIQPYDVVTYDSLSNTLVVSDLRLTCIYEDAAPNAKAPTSIRVLGKDFEVLDSAWDSVDDFSLGDRVTLLLTADGKVAGMAQPGSQARSTAIGVAGTGSAEMFLPNGSTVTLTGTVSNSSVDGQLVSLSSGARGKISAAKLTSKSAPGDFDPAAMKLGDYTVTAGVQVFEKAGSAVANISLAALDGTAIKAGDIDTYHLNTSGMVDYIVLDAVTGDAYTYGILEQGEQPGGSAGGMEYTNRTVTVHNHGSSSEKMITGYSFKDGAFGGAAKGFGSLDGLPKAASVIELTEIKKVSPSDFFESQGVMYVNAGGRTYRVDDDVECYKKDTKSWFTEETGEARLASCRAFSSDLTIYVDPIGQKVRIVQAN